MTRPTRTDTTYKSKEENVKGAAQARPFWTEEDIVSTYTRAQAIEDGVLVDVSETAKEAGIGYPVAITARVWGEVITPNERSRCYGQSEAGRLWDLLTVLRFRASIDRGGAQLLVTFLVIQKERQRRNITLKAICGPGDHGEPVITIMFPDED